MILTAIDPGADQGWAMFFGSRLVGLGLGAPPWVHQRQPSQVCIIEFPQHRPKSRVRVADLLTLAYRVGLTARDAERVGAQVERVFPTTWKGSVPKAIHNRRVLASMPTEDRAILDTCKVAKGKLHNVIDAYGLGKYWLKKEGM